MALALVAGVAEMGVGEGSAEHQVVAHRSDVLAVLDQLEIPGAVHRVAVEHRPHQALVLQHQLLVHAAQAVREHDLVRALAAHEIAGGEQVDAGDLELGRGHRAGVAADAELGQVVGADLGLLEQRRHQAVGDAAVGGAFADGVDARVIGLQGVVHHDAAAAVQAGGLGQRRVGPDARGHHDQVGRNAVAVLEPHRADAARFAAHQFGGLLLQHEPEALGLERGLEHAGGGPVELPFHQPGHEMHHRHLHAAQPQAVGRLQPEQAAADHHRVFVARGGIDHGLGVGDVAVADHPRQVLAGNRQDEGVGAGGEQQPVVRRLGAILGDDAAANAVDPRHLPPGMQRDAIVPVPVEIVEHDLRQRHLPGQHRREQDAVVVAVRLGAEHRDVVELGGELQQFLQRAAARHAVAHHHQLEFFHRCIHPIVRAAGCAMRSGSNTAERCASPLSRPLPRNGKRGRGRGNAHPACHAALRNCFW